MSAEQDIRSTAPVAESGARAPASAGGAVAADSPEPRRRDAAGTRQLLLEAARERFATNGYRSTTVREISDDAGVNVALINRYFTSKVGLFQACLVGAVRDLGGSVPQNISLDEIAQAITLQLTGSENARHPHQLLLLLRSSGDEQAEVIRLNTLRTFAERLATAAGWQADGPDAERIMLKAQVALAATLGIALVRSSTGLQPLASTQEDDLAGPLHQLITALLSRD